jgi:RecB family exonuclease
MAGNVRAVCDHPRMEIVNEFSWSKSRHEKFNECLRLYYFNYYGAWGGWEENAEPEVRELYTLKNLTNRFQWTGSVVHDAIRRALTLCKWGEPPPLDRLTEDCRQRMRAEFRYSRSRRFRQTVSGRTFGLLEHEFGEAISRDDWAAAFETVRGALKAFYQSEWLATARRLSRAQWLPIDEVDSAIIDGVKFYGAPDFAYRVGDRGCVIVDWKTGRPRQGEREQILGYALYATYKWGVEPDRVDGRLVYLGAGEQQRIMTTLEDIQGYRQYLRGSVARMRERLRDSERNRANIEDFPRTEAVQLCAHCAFRRICGRDYTAQAPTISGPMVSMAETGHASPSP